MENSDKKYKCVFVCASEQKTKAIKKLIDCIIGGAACSNLASINHYKNHLRCHFNYSKQTGPS